MTLDDEITHPEFRLTEFRPESSGGQDVRKANERNDIVTDLTQINLTDETKRCSLLIVDTAQRLADGVAAVAAHGAADARSVRLIRHSCVARRCGRWRADSWRRAVYSSSPHDQHWQLEC